MVTSHEMLKGINALNEMLEGMQRLQKDAIYFIAKKNLHEEFMEYHFTKDLERRSK